MTEPTNRPVSPRSRGGRWSTPDGRTALLSIFLLLVGAALVVYGLRWGAPSGRLDLTWWQLAPAMAVAVPLGFHIEVRGEAHTFTLAELPLVLGCLFAPPWAVVLARLLGEGAVQVGWRKQRGLKLGFNMAQLLSSSALTVALFRLFVTRPVTHDWATWPLAALAVVLGDLVGMGAVSAAIHWHGGHTKMGVIAAASVVVVVVNINVAVLLDLVVRHYAPGLALVVIVMALTAFAFKGFSNLSKRYESLKVLYEFTKGAGAGAGEDAEAVLDQMLGKARDLLSAEVAEVVLFDRASGHPAVCRRITKNGSESVPPVGTGDVGLQWTDLARTGQAVYVSRSDRSSVHSALRAQLKVRDFMLAPLRRDDAITGAILVANRLGNVSSFDDGDCRLFEALANHTGVALDNSRLVHQLRREAEERRYEALHDTLTGLANRKLFEQEVDASTASGRPVAVVLMDLDRFKDVNDTLGHRTGDVVLSQVAERLVQVLGDGIPIARLGGDEFAFALPDVGRPEEATQVVHRVLEALRRPLAIGQLSLDMAASTGIALYPAHGSDSATLLQKADVAMYQAKSSHLSTCTYSPGYDNYSARRLALAGALRQAIDDGEVVVYFQPKVDLGDGRVRGAEALARWRHPDLGMLGPDEFIPTAEQSGLIGPLTVYVLRRALHQCREWRQAGYDLGVAVNLSMRSLLDGGLADELGGLLAEVGALPGWLTFEVTESMVMADPARATAVLERLAAMGVRLSVDDFGTGYSSLAYLQRLPVHEVKVDKSFVFGMAEKSGDATIVQSIIELGHNLGLSVVAEGVEDQVTMDHLRRLGCDLAQGFHLCKPGPAAVVTQWLAARDAAPSGAPPDRAAEATGALRL